MKRLGQANTKHAREFKEAWHSLDKQTFNCHIGIPLIHLQLKSSRRSLISSPFITPMEPSTTLPTPNENNKSKTHSMATNDHPVENPQPIRRSRRHRSTPQQKARSLKQYPSF